MLSAAKNRGLVTSQTPFRKTIGLAQRFHSLDVRAHEAGSALQFRAIEHQSYIE